MTEQEIERLFEQYADTVYRVCRTYLGSAADSEDAVQEVFVRLIRNSPAFTTPSTHPSDAPELGKGHNRKPLTIRRATF